MTYIEFFEKTAAENICACLASVPDRVILLGDKLKLLQKHAQRYQELFANRGHRVEFECRTVSKNNTRSIVEALSGIVEAYDDCVFGLTGGEDLYLVAMGIVSERYKHKNIQMHRFNIRNGTVVDCDQDGTTIARNQVPQLSVEENIRAYGGDIVYQEVKGTGTVRWQLDEDFKRDIAAIWSVCAADVRLWNAQIGTLEIAEKLSEGSGGPLTTVISVDRLTSHMKKTGAKFVFSRETLLKLYELGLISEYDCDAYTLAITYKNHQVKKCLTKAGLALEMKMLLTALETRDKDGSPVYNDVMNGVCIDWDGEIHPEGQDTENEIDVIMMHGIVPVFVSCKNGFVEMDELYKLSAVVRQFGGSHAKKVLVATALESRGNRDEYIRQRAEDMNIRLVENIQDMSDQELQRIVKSFWSN